MKRIFLLLILFSGVAKSDMQIEHLDLLEQFRLPYSYSAKASVIPEYPGGQVWRHVQFEVTMNSLFIVRFEILPGVGDSISEMRFGNDNESTLIYAGTQQVQRTNRFAETYTDAGEASLTPMPILRVLQRRADDITIQEIGRTDDGVVTLRLEGSDRISNGYAELDFQNDQLLEYRSGPIKDHFAVIQSYRNWIDLPSGNHVPTQIENTIWDSQSGEYVEAILIEDVKEGADGVDLKPKPVPQGYTVIDHIDGVSKVDGEVLGQINYGKVEDSSGRRNAMRGKQASAWLIWFGGGLVVMAGFLLRNRSKAASL